MIKFAIVFSKVSMNKRYDPLILAETLRNLLTVNKCIVLITILLLMATVTLIKILLKISSLLI